MAAQVMRSILVSTKVNQIVNVLENPAGSGLEDIPGAIAAAEANITIGAPAGQVVSTKLVGSKPSADPRTSLSQVYPGSTAVTDIGRLASSPGDLS